MQVHTQALSFTSLWCLKSRVPAFTYSRVMWGVQDVCAGGSERLQIDLRTPKCHSYISPLMQKETSDEQTWKSRCKERDFLALSMLGSCCLESCGGNFFPEGKVRAVSYHCQKPWGIAKAYLELCGLWLPQQGIFVLVTFEWWFLSVIFLYGNSLFTVAAA